MSSTKTIVPHELGILFAALPLLIRIVGFITVNYTSFSLDYIHNYWIKEAPDIVIVLSNWALLLLPGLLTLVFTSGYFRTIVLSGLLLFWNSILSDLFNEHGINTLNVLAIASITGCIVIFRTNEKYEHLKQNRYD